MALAAPTQYETIDDETALLYADAFVERLFKDPDYYIYDDTPDFLGLLKMIDGDAVLRARFLRSLEGKYRRVNKPSVFAFLWRQQPAWKAEYEAIVAAETTAPVPESALEPKPAPVARPAPAPAPAPAPRRVSKPKGPSVLGSTLQTAKDVLPVPGVVAGVALAAHEAMRAIPEQVVLPDDKDPLPVAKGVDELPANYKYTKIGEIMRRLQFHGESSTGELQNRYVALYERINRAPKGTVFYFDGSGRVLAEMEMPDELIKAQATLKRPDFETKLQAWHNENRKKLSPQDAVCPSSFKDPGYPFVASPTLPNLDDPDQEDADGRTMIRAVMENLAEDVESGDSHPKYFNGEKKSAFDAISEIAQAYDVPTSIILGLGANESGFRRDAISKDKKGNPVAYGIYQFKPEGFEDAKKWAVKHPELSKKFRTEPIGNFNESWKNRFVSAEMACAYYRYLQDQLKDKTEKLEQRLTNMDSSFLKGSLREIAVVNAYNAGEGRISRAIDRFYELSDEQIKARLGEPPYGVDAWLGMMAYSFGLEIGGDSTKVGLHVFTYPQKVLALGALIREEENYLVKYDRSNNQTLVDLDLGLEDASEEVLTQVNAVREPLVQVTGFISVVAGFWAAMQGLRTVKGAKKAPAAVSRRAFMKGALGATLGAAAVAVPVAEALGGLGDKIEEHREERVDAPVAKEVQADPELMAAAKERLDKRFDILQKRFEKDGSTGYTTAEKNASRQADIVFQRNALEEHYRQALGEELMTRFLASKKQPNKKRLALYKEVDAKLSGYIEEQKRSGNLVRFAPDDPKASWFAEQVGRNSGIKNDPDSLFMRKEFEWIIPAVLELVNHQVDQFNANKEVYGAQSTNFPDLPHISALKISGALRTSAQTLSRLTGGQAGSTTKDISPHWLGLALDVGSYATKDGHMLRLGGDLKDENGDVKIKAGEFLPNQGFGARTRDLYSQMIGRAFLALSNEGQNRGINVGIIPLFEAYQLNWHIALNPELSQ